MCRCGDGAYKGMLLDACAQSVPETRQCEALEYKYPSNEGRSSHLLAVIAFAGTSEHPTAPSKAPFAGGSTDFVRARAAYSCHIGGEHGGYLRQISIPGPLATIDACAVRSSWFPVRRAPERRLLLSLWPLNSGSRCCQRTTSRRRCGMLWISHLEIVPGREKLAARRWRCCGLLPPGVRPLFWKHRFVLKVRSKEDASHRLMRSSSRCTAPARRR